MSDPYRNYQSPNDSPRDGTIHPIATGQLQSYQDAALTWPLIQIDRENRCGVCEQNIWFLCDTKGQVYKYTHDEILALVVAHLRQRHSEAV
jgi:hypothetical protein